MAQLRNLWGLRKLVTKQYPVTQVSASAAPASTTVELTQYAQADTFGRLLIRVFGNIVVAGGGAAGAATGLDNPEGLLVNCSLQTSPQVFGVQPFNSVSGRGLRVDAGFNRGWYENPTALVDTTGTQALAMTYELVFKRNKVRNSIEWALPVQPFTSLLLNLTFGGRTQLFGANGGTPNTWDMSGLSIEIYADSDFATNPDQIHAVEVFENTYPVPNTQTDFPIDTLPPGYMYTDMCFIGEVSGAYSDAVISNINIEGGGRVWTPMDTDNAVTIQRGFDSQIFSVPPATQARTGIYAIPIHDGMYSRAIDALTAPITVRLSVTGGANNVVRLVGRRIIPGGIKSKAKKATASA